MSVLFITHDMGVVAEIADRALVMRAGAEVETARRRTCSQRPAAAYTRLLIDAVPRLGSMSGTDCASEVSRPTAHGACRGAARRCSSRCSKSTI